MLDELSPIQLSQSLSYFLSEPLVMINICLHQFSYNFTCRAAGLRCDLV